IRDFHVTGVQTCALPISQPGGEHGPDGLVWCSVRWRVSNRCDPLGARLADRHYSRQKPGTPQFVGNGSSVVLLAPQSGDPCALWVTKWQKYVRTEWWLDAWVCSLFRNEGCGLASELVTEAVAATRA